MKSVHHQMLSRCPCLSKTNLTSNPENLTTYLKPVLDFNNEKNKYLWLYIKGSDMKHFNNLFEKTNGLIHNDQFTKNQTDMNSRPPLKNRLDPDLGKAFIEHIFLFLRFST